MAKVTSRGVKINNVYSTSEIKTDKVWIDGSPIYRKVVELGNLPNATTKSVQHGITNLKMVTSMAGMYYKDVGTPEYIACSFPSVTTNVNYAPYNVAVDSINSTTISIVTGTDRSGFIGFMILEYIKN